MKWNSVAGMENYGRTLARLKREGKDRSEEYNGLLESYMRDSCALMCEKNEDVSRSSLHEMKGIVMMPKVLSELLLDEVYHEVLSACVEEPVAIAQSHSQVFMHEVLGNVIGEVGLGNGGGESSCKLLNIFLKEGLGVLWPRHKYCKILLLQTDSIAIEEWKDCTYHLDYNGDMLEKISQSLPSMHPVFMIMPLGEAGVKLDLGYHGRRSPRSFARTWTKSIRKGSILVVGSFQWHRTGRPNAVEETAHHISKGPKRLKGNHLVCSSDLRLHICIGPDVEYVSPHEVTVTVEKEN